MNWTSEVFVFIFSTFIMGISLGLVISLYQKQKSQFLKYFVLNNLFIFLYMVAGVFQYLLLSKIIFQIQSIIVIPGGIMILISGDYLKRYTVDPVKIFIFGITMGAFLYVLLLTDSVKTSTLNSGESTLKPSQNLQIVGIFITIELLVLFFYYTILVYKFAEKEIKSKAILTVIGGVIYGVATFIFYSFNLSTIIPGVIGLSIAVGLFIVTLSFKLEPRLLSSLINSHNKAKIKLVKKIIPICSHCKSIRIRIEEDKWISIEEFLNDSSNLFLSHSICPSCLTKHYSDLDL